MAQEELKTKEDDTQREEFFFTDLKGIQLISGVTAFSAVLITVVAMLFLPERVDKILIIYVAIFVSIFILIYYTIPSIYLNKRFMLVPDIVFTIALTAVMYALRDLSDFYLIFFYLLIVVDAFAFRFRDFITVVSMIILALLFSNFVLARSFFSNSELIFRTSTQVYSVVTVAIVIRFFAHEALGERKEKEKIRRLAQNTLSAIKQLRTLLDNIGNGIFAVDNDSKIILTNTSAVNILGWKKPIGGKKLSEVMPLYNENMQVVDPVKRVIETQKTISRSDLSISREDESVKLYINVTPVLGPEDQIQGAIILFRDITKEKALEEQKLEFVAVSSHELRTPLTVMEGYLYYLLHNKKLRYDRKVKEYIEKAHNSCLSLQRLITDLLEAAKVEQNQLRISPEELDITELVNEVIPGLKNKVEEAGLELLLEIKQKNIPHLLADKERLKEVLVNLVENAIKFTEKGHIKVSIEKNRNFIKVGVLDTGSGIKREDQKYIFDKFYRVEAWRSKKTRGTGLGLYIAKQVIERFHGKIWVESQIGKGSTFYFVLPAVSNKKMGGKLGKKALKDNKELKEFVSKL